MLKVLARKRTKTIVIARKLKRSYAATRVKASALGVSLGEVEGDRGDIFLGAEASRRLILLGK
jgi:hypothetical protein